LADDDFSLDDVEVAKAEPNALADYDFNFDLDLDDDAEVKPSAGHYDMDLSESPVSQSSAQLDDDFNLDFDLPDDPASEAEDLSDISLALDSLDEDVLPADVETSSDDEFSFDFNELDDDTSAVAKEVETIKAPQLADAENFAPESLGDDFNLEMDVDDLDLAALDHEMEALDKDLDVSDEDLFDGGPVAGEKFDFDDELGDLDLKLDDDSLPGAGAQAITGTNESPLDEELALDEIALEESLPADGGFSFDGDLEALDDELAADEDLSFELADADTLEDDPGATSLEELPEDLSLDADDFDLEAFDGAEDLKALDATFDEASLDELALDEAATDEELLSLDLADEEVPGLEDDLASEFSLDEAPSELQAAHLADNANAHSVEVSEDISDDELFEQALSDFSAEEFTMDETSDMSDDEMDDELDFMADADEAATKLDLARAYIDMGDSDGARDILAEVAQEGNDQQRQEAADLLSRIDA
jgi:pilus assembly protein FimV